MAKPILERQNEAVKSQIDDYNSFFASGSNRNNFESRKASYTTMINHYYDLVTDFYEYGWGVSFHFANRFEGETFLESIQRHESYLALRLGLKQGDRVADMGCGVGGPLRRIARLSGAHITGINNNEYQVKRAQTKFPVPKGCKYLRTDFMHIDVPDGSFDAVYAIEATCHAPDRVACYSEVNRILKPGGLFAAYEWVMTKKYNPKDEYHRHIKHWIEEGDSLPDILRAEDIVEALKKSGFEVLECTDLAENSEISWYQPLDNTAKQGWSLQTFRSSWFGRITTRYAVMILEKIRIAPTGSVAVLDMLEAGAKGLVEGGRKEIFTPLLFFLARKPEQKSN